MIKKNILWSTLISCVFLICLSRTSFAEHPALRVMSHYATDLESVDVVNPYIVSILALNEVEQGRHLDEVQQYILWYFSRLNYPDQKGLTGTIYDYAIENGRERPTNQYDSVDGYAGIFLHLLRQYVNKTHNHEIVLNNWDKIEDIAYLIPFLQEKNGLTRALSDRSEIYLMDNCESYGGISAYIALRNLAGKGESAYYSQARDAIKKAILVHLYDPKKKMFSWAVANNKKSRTDWNRFYPDAFAQLFPIYFGLLADTPDLRRSLWREFSRRYSAKAEGFPIEQRIIYEFTKMTMEGISHQ
jgi:hypothetical protein